MKQLYAFYNAALKRAPQQMPPIQIQIDPLSAAVASLAVWLSIRALRETNAQQKRDACFKMLELWTSEHYRRCRNEVYCRIYAELSKTDGGISLDTICATDSDFDRDFWTVIHFFEHLSDLIAAGLIDKRLASALYASSLVDWFKLLASDKFSWDSQQSMWDAHLSPLLDHLEIRTIVYAG